MKKISLVLIVVFILVMFTGCKKSDYNEAIELMNNGNYEQAIVLLEELGDYEDAAAKLAEAQNKNNIVKALNEGVWYFEADSVNAVNRLLFSDGKATITQAFFDGNGYHESSTVTNLTYKITDAEIVLVKEDLSEIKVAYTVDDNGVKLDDAYFTPEMIEDGIQGYWKLRKSSFLLGRLLTNEYNIYFNKGNVESESAAEARGYDDGSYYYYGPYEGTYTIDFGKFETNMDHGDQWFFRIDEGEVQVMHYGDACTKSDKLPGEDGYSF
jgi:hypothetical protein